MTQPEVQPLAVPDVAGKAAPVGAGHAVLDVALACGFVSASHFSKCNREIYGRTPRNQRQADA